MKKRAAHALHPVLISRRASWQWSEAGPSMWVSAMPGEAGLSRAWGQGGPKDPGSVCEFGDAGA